MPDPTTLLIVDDDEVLRRTTARVLDRAGYRCLEAGTATQALTILETDPAIVAVLSDIRMPGRSGLDLLRQVAADFPDVAVVMTTGVDEPTIASTAFEIGAYGYVVKPFTPNELIIAVANALNRRTLEIARREGAGAPAAAVTRTKILSGVINGIDGPSAGIDEGDVVERLSRALTLRDEETGRHIERMSRYAAVLAEAIGFDEMTPEEVRLATALHDVGKIGVPDGVLLKPGRLLPDEYALMQKHAQIGYQLLSESSSSILEVAAEIALLHHEWWDGTGYPRGLRGEEIPLIARIAAIADVFDALTSNRVYRPGMSIDEAVRIMTETRGTQFEPRLLDAFFSLMDQILAIREAFPDEGADEGRIRVLVVDDHGIFSASLVRMLSSKPVVKVVGTAASVAEAKAAVVGYKPDVVLMDFELPDGDGAQATEQIKLLEPTTKVVMLTGRSDEEPMLRAIEAGCSGFITKHEAVDALVDAIVAAHDGETVGALADIAPLLRRLRPTSRGLGNALAAREVEVLNLVAEGLPNKEIAQRLGLRLNTVRNHVQNTLYKLNAHSKLEAVATAVREGVITYPAGNIS